MATRERAGDRGAEDARERLGEASRELRLARRSAGLSLAAAARRAGLSPTRLGDIERRKVMSPGFEGLCRAARAVGLKPAFRLYPSGEPVVDSPQLAVLGRLEKTLGRPLAMSREVALPIVGDLRAWDVRITDGRARASIDAEARLHDIQAVARRVALKARDDPGCGSVILVLNRTAHNRHILAEHRESLRAQFPLDGAAILRAFRVGQIPATGGILLI
jgi:transcriptional regulator with XRE-family HTH domain